MSPSTTPSGNRKHSQTRHSIVDRCSTIRACEPCRRRKRLCNGQKPCLLCKTESIECVYSVISDHPRGVFTTNTARRLSSGSACETCRRRKTKCDGSNPCAFCAANNLKCVNNAERRKRASISVTTSPPSSSLSTSPSSSQQVLSPSSSSSSTTTSPLPSTSRSSSTITSTALTNQHSSTTQPGSDHETMDRIEDRLRRIEQLMTVFSPSPLSQSTIYPDNNKNNNTNTNANRRNYRNNSTAGSHFNLPPHFVRQQRHSVQGIAVAKEQLELKIARRAMSSSPPQFGHTPSPSSERLHAGAYITPPNSGGKNQQQQAPSPPPLSPEQSSTMIRQTSNQSHPLTSSMLNLTLSPSSSISSSSNSSSMHLLQSSLSTPLNEQQQQQQQQQHAYSSFGSFNSHQQRDYHPITSTAVPPMPSLMDQLSKRTFVTNHSDYPVRTSYPIYPLSPSPTLLTPTSYPEPSSFAP
ncbi:hypothetical protein BC941DRAFT_508694 [Chlamydoabsidia padenii]|nr:hypothetical protein BC941DRAFT_508694 [Chlamydoabsidia padenii]